LIQDKSDSSNNKILFLERNNVGQASQQSKYSQEFNNKPRKQKEKELYVIFPTFPHAKCDSMFPNHPLFISGFRHQLRKYLAMKFTCIEKLHNVR